MAITLSKIAGPYAEALFDLAKSGDSLERITIDMVMIGGVLSKPMSISKILRSPLIEKHLKKQMMTEVFSGQINGFVFNLLLVLLDRGRIEVVEDIAEIFLKLSHKHDSIEIAKITSYIPLDARRQEEIAEKLKLMTGAKQIKLALKIDPELLGGLTIEIGSTLIDTSIRGKLRQISTLLGV